jgi:hypothetical protein
MNDPTCADVLATPSCVAAHDLGPLFEAVVQTYNRAVTSRSQGSADAVVWSSPASRIIGGRFRIDAEVGQGGVATVYSVCELGNERQLALKQLKKHPDPRRQRRSLQLFEREYYTLAQLAHPRIVEVRDYGTDDEQPYYTMELLDGGDLHQAAPLQWQRACSLARDVCSALSLLHSRRMVYRDLSPRNVRCTSDGLAKLIDFGALAPMGPIKQVVGTPAYSAPEVINLQPLDARTDLYALGATLYYVLTGRHAYPAKDFSALRTHWTRTPPAPSRIVAGIPAELDALVLSLMHLDAAARPPTAAEVMERLAAIEGRELDEHLLVSRSYLSTPNLVGRETLLARARAKTLRAVRGRGGALVVEGDSGAGRSRFVDACVLEGRVLGALVLRADSSDADGEYGVVRALAARLLETAAEPAMAAAQGRLPLLRHAVPDLGPEQDAPLQTFSDPQEQRSQVLRALCDWLLEVSSGRPLMLAVDDLHRIDEPSAAMLALLAHDLQKRALALVVSTESKAEAKAPSALKLLAGAATRVALTNLTAVQTEELLRSVFGDVPHVATVADKLHTLSLGNPRDVMQLAQHLLDKGVVRYQAGAWTLPASIDARDLPATMAQALSARIDALTPAARELASAMALCPDRGMTLEECVILSSTPQASAVMQSLNELLEAQVSDLAGESYVIARRGWVSALTHGLDDALGKRLHRRLAEVFARRADEGFRVAQHLLRAGELEAGLDALVAHAEASQRITVRDPDEFFKLVQSMPADWFQCYADAIELCERVGRPRQHAFTMRRRFAGLVGVMGIPDDKHFPQLIAVLADESGLTDYAALDPATEPSARLKQALDQVQQRNAARPESERLLDLVSAIRQLARTMIEAIGLTSASLDYGFWKTLPSLEPLTPLSPALGVVQLLVRGNGARITGRAEQARESYLQLLERTAQPDRGGLDESHHRYTRTGVMCGMGMIEASMGRASCLQWAEQIEGDPLHHANALLIQMLQHLAMGNLHDADRCKDRVEVLRIQGSARQVFEGTHLLGQIVLNAAAEDLTRVKQSIDEIEVLARRYPNWVPVHHYALGEYHRIRGDHVGALARLEAALELTRAGEHQLWANIAGAHTRALCDLERHVQARDRAREHLQAAERAGLGYACNYIRMPFAIALAKLGETGRAVSEADAVIESFRTLGTEGILLGTAYETRARVAIEAQDQAGLEKYAALCAEHLRARSTRALAAKHARLRQTAALSQMQIGPDLTRSTGDYTEDLTRSQLTSVLDGCHGPSERSTKGLILLLRLSGAQEGVLYLMSDRGPELAAQVGELAFPERMDAFVQEYVESELRERDCSTTAFSLNSGPAVSNLSGKHGERYRPVLLAHQSQNGFVITGVAVLIVQPGAQFTFPSAVAAQLSRFVQESGDAAPALIAAD